MDKSAEYIKMCEKAVEIQEAWEPIGGDWLLHDYRGTTKFGRRVEKQIWGDDNNKWNSVEILSYQPDDKKNFWIEFDEEPELPDYFRKNIPWKPINTA